jgi:beta-1,4-mannosyl-glycoprotein beta-1,4-N-acetylglucosaminyltransferase
MKLYDCFQFYNELDLLEIRLTLLYDVVDYFVISETTKSHANNPKKLFFEENKSMFDKFSDKIIHIKHNFPEDILNMGTKIGNDKYTLTYNKISERYDIEENEGELKKHPTFCRDYLQKEFIKFGLMDCEDDDLIMISDLDEIPKPEIVKKIRENNLYNHCLMQDCFYYYINLLAHTNWYGNYIVKFSDTKEVSLTHLKNKRVNFEKIFDGGWHLSFMGGVERVKTKIQNYAHQEFNNDFYLNNVATKIKNGVDVYNRFGYSEPFQEFFFSKMKETSLTQYPTEMLDLIKEKYNYLIKQ